MSQSLFSLWSSVASTGGSFSRSLASWCFSGAGRFQAAAHALAAARAAGVIAYVVSGAGGFWQGSPCLYVALGSPASVLPCPGLFLRFGRSPAGSLVFPHRPLWPAVRAWGRVQASGWRFPVSRSFAQVPAFPSCPGMGCSGWLLSPPAFGRAL